MLCILFGMSRRCPFTWWARTSNLTRRDKSANAVLIANIQSLKGVTVSCKTIINAAIGAAFNPNPTASIKTEVRASTRALGWVCCPKAGLKSLRIIWNSTQSSHLCHSSRAQTGGKFLQYSYTCTGWDKVTQGYMWLQQSSANWMVFYGIILDVEKWLSSYSQAHQMKLN